MIFIVQFADGDTVQITASAAWQAKKAAITKFKDGWVVAVRPAGLLEMGYRTLKLKVFN